MQSEGTRANRLSRPRRANDTGNLDITDAIYLLGHLFLGTEGPPPPSSAPGTDPTPDGLGC